MIKNKRKTIIMLSLIIPLVLTQIVTATQNNLINLNKLKLLVDKQVLVSIQNLRDELFPYRNNKVAYKGKVPVSSFNEKVSDNNGIQNPDNSKDDDMKFQTAMIEKKQVTKSYKRNLPSRSGTRKLMITGYFNEDRGDHLHQGLDIKVPEGTPIKAVLSGVLYQANQGDKAGFGKYVYIVHDNGLTSYYGHLKSWADIREGEIVQQGQVIGYSGNTGFSSGPHLHFEIRKNNVAINPLDIFMLEQIYNLIDNY